VNKKKQKNFVSWRMRLASCHHVSNPRLRRGTIVFVHLDPDRAASRLDRCQKRRARPRERIEHHRVGFTVKANAPAWEVEWERARMIELLRYYVATATSQNWTGSDLIR